MTEQNKGEKMTNPKDIFKIVRENYKPEMGKPETQRLSLENTQNYDLHSPFSGKFICVPGDKDYFLAVGNSSDELSNRIQHVLMKRFLADIAPRTKEYDGITAGGIVDINPELKVILFYGKSGYFNKGFSREQVIPVAQRLKDKTGLVNKVVIVSEEDDIQRGLTKTRTRPDGILGYVYDALGGDPYNRNRDPFLAVLEKAKLLESMVVDLE